MKAVVYERYGPPEVLGVREVDDPVPGEHDVLIAVRAASVNASDWEGLRGKPLYARISGLLKPKHQILGSDVAGTVEAVGSEVQQFRPGDEVFGDILYFGSGGFAEYVCVSEKAPLVPKPPGLTFAQAAALPQAAVIALQGLKGKVQPGDRVLIIGAGGGAGSFAVQLAKSAGAEVTAVDNGLKKEFLSSLGADDFVDYTREDFSRRDRRYDLILDLAGHRSIFAYARTLARCGRYSVVGGSVVALLQAAALGPIVGRFGKKKLRVLIVRPNTSDLALAAEMVVAGQWKTCIDRTYALSEVPEAVRHLGEGRALGKVVVSVA